MIDPHDRRSFFKELLRGAAQAAGEVGSLAEEELDAEPAYAPPAEADLQQATVAAAAAERLASADHLRALCAELGLAAWAEEAVALARPSIRLTRAVVGSSRLGGDPDVPPGFEWPVWREEELTLVGQVRLDELPESLLPPSGTLLVFFALTSQPSGMRPSDAGACRVMHVADGPKERVERNRALPELPVVPSAELTLPLEPSLLGDTADIGAWTRLRERLAALQEVELEETSADYHALHRLLGYPDVLVDGMELEAQLVAHGVDLTGAEHYVDARVEELRPGAASWRLLFQLSSDDDLGVALGDYERLYVWIREGDLASGRFDRVRAFVR